MIVRTSSPNVPLISRATSNMTLLSPVFALNATTSGRIALRSRSSSPCSSTERNVSCPPCFASAERSSTFRGSMFSSLSIVKRIFMPPLG